MISRRTFLRGLGGVGLAMPLLQVLPGRSARAAEAFPRRLIVFFNPNGTLKERWSPSGTETDFALPEILGPLERHKRRLVITDGIDMPVSEEGPGGPHNRGMASLLTGEIIREGPFPDGDGRLAGWAGGISIDQFVARELGAQTRFTTLELGVRALDNEPRARISYLGPDQPVPPENDPHNVWQRLFAPMDADPEVMRKLLVQRRSVLDVVRGDFERLNRKLAPEDRHKLGQHFEAVRDLERRLGLSVPGGAGGSSGGVCQRPEIPPQMEVGAESEFERVASLQMDLAVMSLACDLTRVVSIAFSTALNALRFTFMGMHDQDGHSLSHAGDASLELQDQWARMLTWYTDQFASLLDRLEAIPEGEGTLLDNCLVLWCNELSRGNTHSHDDMPFILAGGAGGALRTGRHLVYDREPHNNLLLAVAQLMGVEADTFGHPEFCTRPLPL
jgi:hypothetical protein